MRTWSCVRLDKFELYARLSHGPEGGCLPVGLGVLLPHDRVELVVVLVGEDEAHVVVVNLSVDKEGSFKVYSSESVEADSEAGVRVHGLDNLRSLVVNHPVRVNLGVSVRVKNNSLIGPEVCRVDLAVVGAIVHKVHDVIAILIVLTNVSASIT